MMSIKKYVVGEVFGFGDYSKLKIDEDPAADRWRSEEFKNPSATLKLGRSQN